MIHKITNDYYIDFGLITFFKVRRNRRDQIDEIRFICEGREYEFYIRDGKFKQPDTYFLESLREKFVFWQENIMEDEKRNKEKLIEICEDLKIR